MIRFFRQRQRRSALIALSIAALAASAVACGSNAAASDPATSSVPKIRIAVWNVGVTGLLPLRLAEDKELQKKYGIEVEALQYKNLDEVYAGLLAGRSDANVGSPDTFASMADKGGPLHIAGTAVQSTAGFIGKTGPITDASQLKGKRVAALTKTGTWALMNLQIQKQFGLTAGKDYDVVTAPDFLSGAAQVEAGTADYAMGWEPSLFQATQKFPDLHTVLQVKDLTKATVWQFVVGVRDDIPAKAQSALISALKETAQWLDEHPQESDKYGPTQSYKKGFVESFLKNDQTYFEVNALDKTSIDSLKGDFQLLVDAGRLKAQPAESFFIQANS